jgi:hypothetical protein
MEDVSIFYVHLVNFLGHLAYFMAIWYISPFCYIFNHIGMFCKEKSGNPG